MNCIARHLYRFSCCNSQFPAFYRPISAPNLAFVCDRWQVRAPLSRAPLCVIAFDGELCHVQSLHCRRPQAPGACGRARSCRSAHAAQGSGVRPASLATNAVVVTQASKATAVRTSAGSGGGSDVITTSGSGSVRGSGSGSNHVSGSGSGSNHGSGIGAHRERPRRDNPYPSSCAATSPWCWCREAWCRGYHLSCCCVGTQQRCAASTCSSRLPLPTRFDRSPTLSFGSHS